ncbi:MAG: 8-oxo-dGTP diphosphatase MutT [Gammaproteobacteria bacterium]|nr:8-oxo-dGTP diphosphatase MutT [Gammaproteobacteria bacterium]MBT8104563.1 8-oxo-dGTP diphosphatase MutT [Gammaproteobacteria bacterium]NNF49496.1 8-oxo-dGTP diphosphatase MutT [Woeseiaceae bacterium]NNK24577.1 8-oxo-dGTP diphosphatase MutT [Woeseiaceae bacterium]NNL63327.1 8-oxo-dGTP diphosphatase MutT [Woeseiaceae bacterium]
MDHFHVAAGILCDTRGRVLIAERLGGGPFHGLWEFPGGKIGDDETPVQALSRELAEELGIEVTTCASFMNLRHEYDDRVVTIEFFIVIDWLSEPVGREGQELRWVPREQLDADELLPADVPVVEALRQHH